MKVASTVREGADGNVITTVRMWITRASRLPHCEHCGIAQFMVIESRTGQPYLIYLHAAHADPAQSKSEPQPHLIALCVRCHARYDYAIKQRAARVALERLKHQRQRERARQGIDQRWFGG